MTRYIALLRGINVGGNNKIDMKELKIGFESCGFTDVSTYINSGNILFDSESVGGTEIRSTCEAMIFERFGLSISTNVILASDLIDALANAPDWWNADKEIKHNAIFVIPPLTTEEVFAAMDSPKPEYERVACHGQVIFWSAPLATFSRTSFSKVVGNKPIYNAITIRNANTTQKLAELARE